MKKYFTVLLSLLIGVSSCQDLKKDKQLSQISHLDKSVDSIRNTFTQLRMDSIGQINTSIMDVEYRIRRNYSADTIDYALGEKVNAYKNVRKKLKNLGKIHIQLDKGTLEEKEALKKLKNDISQNAGDESKYDEYIVFEKNKVRELELILKEMIKTQDENMKVYSKLHQELYDFSFSLIKN